MVLVPVERSLVLLVAQLLHQLLEHDLLKLQHGLHVLQKMISIRGPCPPIPGTNTVAHSWRFGKQLKKSASGEFVLQSYKLLLHRILHHVRWQWPPLPEMSVLRVTLGLPPGTWLLKHGTQLPRPARSAYVSFAFAPSQGDL